MSCMLFKNDVFALARSVSDQYDITWLQDDCVGYDSFSKGWYFYDESYDTHGPYTTEHEARIDLAIYCHFNLECGINWEWSQHAAHIKSRSKDTRVTEG